MVHVALVPRPHLPNDRRPRGGPGTFWHVTDVNYVDIDVANVVLTHDFVIARKSRKDGETLSQGQVYTRTKTIRPARPLHEAAEATLASPWRRTSDRDLYADCVNRHT